MSYELFAIADALGDQRRQSERQAWLWHDHAKHLESINAIHQADKSRLAQLLRDQDKRVASLESQLRQAKTARAAAEGKSRTLAEVAASLDAAQRDVVALRAELDATRQVLEEERAASREQAARAWYYTVVFLLVVRYASTLEKSVSALGGELPVLPEFNKAEEALQKFGALANGAVATSLRDQDERWSRARQKRLEQNSAKRTAGVQGPLETLTAENAALKERVAALESRLSRTDTARRYCAAKAQYFLGASQALYEFGLMYERLMKGAGVPIPEEEPEMPDIAALCLKWGVPIDKAVDLFSSTPEEVEQAKARYAELVAAKLAEAEQSAEAAPSSGATPADDDQPAETDQSALP